MKFPRSSRFANLDAIRSSKNKNTLGLDRSKIVYQLYDSNNLKRMDMQFATWGTGYITGRIVVE